MSSAIGSGIEANRDASRAVVVRFLDGQTITGRVARFSPDLPDVMVEAAPSAARLPVAEAPKPGRFAALIGAPKTARTAMANATARRQHAAEKIAYVGFPSSGPRPARANVEGDPGVRVHVVGGEPIDVVLGAKHPIGFFATPLDDASPYEELFFYEHGVRARTASARRNAHRRRGDRRRRSRARSR
jgi:hypothetical protein